MTEPERAALEHIRRVIDSVIGESLPVPAPAPVPVPPADAEGEAEGFSILPVPYVSQIGEGANQFSNDSGAAAGVMLVLAYTDKTMTPNEFFAQSGQISDVPLSLKQLSKVLAANGVVTEQRAGLKLGDLALIIATGRPVLLLVKYAVLQLAGLAPETYNGAHYLVAVGLDVKNIYVHDPFRYDDSGRAQPIPWLVFYQAWSQAPDFERAALIPRQPLIRRVRVTSDTLNIRREPNGSAALAGTARLGELYEVTAVKDGWGKVGDGLWISMKHVADI